MTERPNRLSSNPPASRRLFLHEPGWQIGVKIGSEREFCDQKAPGQNDDQRLLDHEVYLYNNEARIGFACAERRGLLSFEPKALRQAIGPPRCASGEGPDLGLPLPE
ncbi:MAG: hypothetical protein JO116_01395 [Planctomycetaceae bacterium]|nr:hypothetical protein [Planctomycetaceae bacterium]